MSQDISELKNDRDTMFQSIKVMFAEIQQDQAKLKEGQAGIKTDTELILEYMQQYGNRLEDLFDSVDNLEDFLIDKLGTDWDKIKDAWRDFKKGKINRKQFIWRGFKLVGKRFGKKLLPS